MHFVFNHFWTSYYPAVYAFVDSDYISFIKNTAKLFPIQAKCNYYNIGPSGSMQEFDALCFLPQNNVSQKIFVVLYIWYIIIFVMQVVNCIYESLYMLSPYLRKCHLSRMCQPVSVFDNNNFTSHFTHHGVWFSLGIIEKNMSPILFQDLLKDLIEKTETKKAGGGKQK